MATSNDLNISEAGMVSFDGTAIFHGRTLTAGTGITITNGNGVSGNPVISSSGDNDLHTAQFIVNSSGTVGTGANFSNITAAVAAAQGTGLPQTIFIMPGSTGIYTEDFTLPANINLTAFDCDALTPTVTIVGKITCTDAGSRSISGIRLQTNSDNFLAITGNAATVVNLTNCYLNCTNNTGINYSSSSGSSILNIDKCKGDVTANGITLFSCSSSGSLNIDYTNIFATGSTTTASTNSAANLQIRYSKFFFPFSITGSGNISMLYCDVETQNQNTTSVSVNTSVTCAIEKSVFASGSASAISVDNAGALTLIDSQISSSNTNAITGTGTIRTAALVFDSTSANINTSTQSIQPYLSLIPRTATSTTPYTVLSTDYYISVDASGGAKQVNLPNSPSTNQIFIVKDRLGNAGSNNITVTTPGGVVNLDGATTYVINTNYGAAQFILNGTSYEVF